MFLLKGIVEDVEVIKKELVAVTVLNPSDLVKVMVKHPRLQEFIGRHKTA